MKTTKQRPRTSSETKVTQSSMNISIRRTRAKTPTKIPRRRQQKSTGRSNTCSIEKDKLSKKHPIFAAETKTPDLTLEQALPDQLPVMRTFLPETSSTKHESEQEKKSSSKIKLQLFPIDLSTQIALEKGGYNPHLELTLSKQKKISSVLKHIKSKWGSVYNSSDEVMLFPYDINLENKKWTLEDTDTNASDVHKAIGSPEVFRLKYGWQQCGTKDDQITEQEKQPSYTSLLWGDSLTNISIGGLLSETSLNAIGNQHDSMGANIRNSSSQQIPFSCDSFDAAIAAHIYRHSEQDHQQRAPPPPSFLDAEETCHGFPCQKIVSSGNKEIITSSKTEASLLSGINWSESMNPFDLSLSSSRRLASENEDISLSDFLANSVDAFQNFKLFAKS